MASHDAAGLGGVTSQLLKQYASGIVKLLCILYKSMNVGTFPALLKKAISVLIYNKRGTHSAPCACVSDL